MQTLTSSELILKPLLTLFMHKDSTSITKSYEARIARALVNFINSYAKTCFEEVPKWQLDVRKEIVAYSVH